MSQATVNLEDIDVSSGLESFVLAELGSVAHEAGRRLLKMRNAPSERVINSALRIQSRWPEDWMLLYGMLRGEGLTDYQVAGALRDMELTTARLTNALGREWLSYMVVFAVAGSIFTDGNEPLQELRGPGWSDAVATAAEVAQRMGIMVDLGDPTGAEHRDWCATRGAAWAVAVYEDLDPGTRKTLMTPWATLVRPEFLRRYWLGETKARSVVTEAFTCLMSSAGGRELLSVEWEWNRQAGDSVSPVGV